jgi:hypothetical protein
LLDRLGPPAKVEEPSAVSAGESVGEAAGSKVDSKVEPDGLKCGEVEAGSE